MTAGNPIISVRGLSKKYHIGSQEKANRSLRETITDIFTSPLRNLREIRKLTRSDDKAQDTIWALKDIAFEVSAGEVIGIIGRNGAGKSTLLKILSRITEPTSGEIILHGRVASLLEVGTGFHPDLTGRDNIYLNGTILGMRKHEIDRKFDEIVAFSEIERFLDTPVKRYSSGMYVRLAFAVAAHLEPEILLVDEVLAVGDAAFQKKCLGKMGDVAKEGRTVLFVSHNMGAIAELCEKVILLRNGSLDREGPSKKIISQYLSGGNTSNGSIDLTEPHLRWRSLPTNNFSWIRSTVINSKGTITSQINALEPFELILHGKSSAYIRDMEIAFAVYSDLGFALFNSTQRDHHLPDDLQAGDVFFHIKFDPNLFGPGQYYIDIFATAPVNQTSPSMDGATTIDYIRTAAIFSISPVYEDKEKFVRNNYGGIIFYPCTWEIDMHKD